MNYLLDSFLLDDNKFDNYRIEAESTKRLGNLAKINIFIGANNSGKSQLIRSLFASENLNYTYKYLNLKSINDEIAKLKQEVKTLFEAAHITNYDNVNEIINSIKEVQTLDYSVNFKQSLFRSLTKIISVRSDGQIFSNRISSIVDPNAIASSLRNIGERYETSFQKLIPDYLTDARRLSNIYIPTLRGLRTIVKNKDVYLERTIKDYFTGIDNETQQLIFTGLDLYDQTRKLLLGSRDDRKKVKDFEDFLSKSFFDNQVVTLTPHIDDDALHVGIGDSEYPIYKLGDGIQSVIILTYPLFFNQGSPKYFFIEEPEHYLHPGFQRLFIETLLRPEFDSFQYFITTHSNHLLDLTLDESNIAVYTLHKKEDAKFYIENVNNAEVRILELLGAKNSSVFLSNCTIWVEGITDRIYLRKYLQLIQEDKKRKFKEDLHYSFVEYGGGNITHWSFLKDQDCDHPNINVSRLCGRLFLVTDKDSAGLKIDGQPKASQKKKYERHLELAITLDKRYYCLEGREIENLLHPEILKKIVQDYEVNKGNTISLVFKNFNQNEYKDKYIGKFINENVVGRKKNYADESGTINDKVSFAKKAVEFISDKNLMTQEAIHLADRIYDFIKSNNS